MSAWSDVDQLKDKIAVVTGAASGLGRAMAERFVAEGMHVVLADVEAGPLHAVAEELAADGASTHAVVTDVSRHDAVTRLADEAFDRFGAVHVLCNNAGVTKRARAWNLTLDDWHWVLGVDLWGVIHGVQAFVPRMIAMGEPGHIVNTGSMSGLLAIPNLSAYGTAKAAVVSFSEALQLDLDAEGSPLGVSVLCPGFIATAITDSARNRPDELHDTAPVPGVARTSAGVVPTMDASEVAAAVVDAIRTNQFWVLTHQEYRPLICERAEGIGAGGRPAAPPIW